MRGRIMIFSKTLLVALASITAMAVVAQDPSFDFPAAQHVGYESPSEATQGVATGGQATTSTSTVGQTAGQATTAATGATQTLSVSFKKATFETVLDTLRDQGVSFLVRDGMIDKDQTVTLNMVNQPVSAVMAVLGEAMGGTFRVKESVWVFEKGWGMAVPSVAFAEPDVRVFAAPEPMTDAQRKAIEKSMADPKRWEQFSQDMEKWGEKFGRDMDGKAWKFSDADRQAVEAQIKASKAWKFSDADRKRVEIQLKEMTGQAAKAIEEAKAAQGLAPSVGETEFWLQRSVAGHTIDLRKIYDSMTPTQRARMNGQGYLNASDLTPKQRALLGSISGGSWTLSYSENGKKLVIKSDR